MRKRSVNCPVSFVAQGERIHYHGKHSIHLPAFGNILAHFPLRDNMVRPEVDQTTVTQSKQFTTVTELTVLQSDKPHTTKNAIDDNSMNRFEATGIALASTAHWQEW